MNQEELFEHIKAGRLSQVEDLLAVNPDLLYVKDEHSLSPLHQATEYGQTEIAKFLISKGAEIEARDNEQETPLFRAVHRSFDMTELLLQAGADIHVRNIFKRTPLHVAAFYGRTRESQLLIDHGADIHSKDQSDCTPLHEAADYGVSEEVLLLIKNGADVNRKCSSGYTPLHVAVSARSIKRELHWYLGTIEMLLQHGADINMQTENGKTPLQLAMVENANFPEIMELLIKNGARQSETG